MREIAADAGVSERTVYLTYPSKPALLSAVIRLAVRGDEPSARMLDSPTWQRILDAPTDELVPVFAKLVERVLHDAAALLAVGESAAATDPELRTLRDRGRDSELALFRAFAQLLDQRGVLDEAVTVAMAADTLYAVASPAVYLRLTGDRRWARRRYVSWLERTVTASLLLIDR